MTIKYYTDKTAILYNLFGNQKSKDRNIKSKKNHKKELK